ncbi:hypothetical protein HDU81_005332 [Chytriomyces hyalinus]|nr:hypothetical protein HDU81_005332 [Chytriomyces hyalinus]
MASTTSSLNSTNATANSTTPVHVSSTISHFLAPGAFNAIMLFLAIVSAGILLGILTVYAVLLPTEHVDRRELDVKREFNPQPSCDSVTTLPSAFLSVKQVPENGATKVVLTPTFVQDDLTNACVKELNSGTSPVSEDGSARSSIKATYPKQESPTSQFMANTARSSGKTSPTSESPILIAKRKLKKTTSQNLLCNSSQTDLCGGIDASFAPSASTASPKSSLEHMEAWSKTRFGSPAANKAVAEQVEQFGELEKWSGEQLALWFGNEFGPEIGQALLLKEISGKDLRIMTRDDLRMKLGLTGRDIVKVEVGVAGLLRRGQMKS